NERHTPEAPAPLLLLPRHPVLPLCLLCQPRVSPSLLYFSQVHPWAPCHAEQCFLSWFRDQYPYRDEDYNVTWFLSWSPCPTCAEEVVEFLEEYRNLTLSIFTSRLYYFWHPSYQEGLCKLWDAGVQLDIMSCDEFEYCWDNFVYHKGKRFQRWNLLKDYDFLAAKLQEILR
uniref:DNA dC->dU-editing enzyme APOBEC-3Ca-like n=1 Tax=Panthera onca TaxID=9690 RepID=UPI0029546262